MRRFWDVVAGVAWRSIKKFATNPQLLLPSLIFPLFFFVAFAGGLSSVGDVPGFDFPSGYTAFQFVFVLLQASAFGGVFTGFGIASDFENGFSRRLMLAAPNRLGILFGYALSAMIRAAIVGVLLFTVAIATGMQVHGDGVDLFGLIVLALIVNFTAAMWARAWRCGCARSRPGRRCRCRCSSCCSWRRSTCRWICWRAGSRRSRTSTRSPRWSRAAATSSRGRTSTCG
jgi:ABC-2 type transport system permease protein